MREFTIQQAMQIAVAHQQASRVAEAEGIYRQVLSRQPNHPDALHLLGVLAGQAGKPEVAIELIGRALQINPGNWTYHNNLSQILHGCGQFDGAIAACREAIRLRPDSAGAHYNLGNAFKAKGEPAAAIQAYQLAIRLDPTLALAYNNLGAIYFENRRLDEAVAAFEKAIEVNPDCADAYNNLANALKDQGQTERALACVERAIILNPDDGLLQQSRLYLLHFHPGFEPAAFRREHAAWNDRHARPRFRRTTTIRPPSGGTDEPPNTEEVWIPAHDNDPAAERGLRIGYVSADFRNHVVGRNIFPLLAHHDHDPFEIHCFSSVLRPDDLTARFEQLSDRWHKAENLSDAALAELIQREKIDILVDLTLHMHGTRLLTFARKPAPVQVTFAGYPGTTGLQTINYRLTDPYLDPPGQNDADYVEQSIRLPESFWCYDPAAMTIGLANPPEVGPLPARSTGQITFGCLNNFCKVNDGVLALWARVLRAVPKSHLLLSAQPGVSRQRALTRLAQEGVEPDRVQFVELLPREQYLRVYHRIDVGLDTLPYNGHTTSLDALWMGVPVVTLIGRTVVGRAGLSQCSNLGLSELVANTPEQYVRVAAELAGDLDHLAILRATLRGRMLQSPLTDAMRFARNIETAYRQMWRRWCAGR